MSEVINAVVVRGSLPIPVGSTPRQVRLAELALQFDPEVQTLSGICEQAGYAKSTAVAMARRTLNAVGVNRASTAIQATRADKARDLTTVGIGLISSADKNEISDRDKIALGAALVKTGHEIGETVEQRGEGSGWKQRISRAVLLAYRLGFLAGTASNWGLKRHRIPPPTTSLD